MATRSPTRKPPATAAANIHDERAASRRVRVGVGGWTYGPWRDNFYPRGLPQSQELGWAARQLTAIEVNGTYYSSFKPATFAKWRDETPEGFVFSLKASRFATNRKVLAEAGPSVERFVGSGIGELGSKLGPIVWQFMPTKVFDAQDFGAFLNLLPREVGGRPLRHALDVRHPSFMCPAYLAMAREHGCATVFTDSDDYPSFADLTGDFVYARLMRCEAQHPTGYAPEAIDRWATALDVWAAGGEPVGVPRIGEPASARAGTPRAVFAFFISGAKERAPGAAMALLKALESPPDAMAR
jgi:uncharacterized protein YecE (DUF72 family)